MLTFALASIFAVALSFVLGYGVGFKFHLKERGAIIAPIVAQLVESIRSDDGWKIWPRESTSVETWKNDVAGIVFTLEESTNTGAFGGMVKPSKHCFSKAEWRAVDSARQEHGFRLMLGAREKLLDSAIAQSDRPKQLLPAPPPLPVKKRKQA